MTRESILQEIQRIVQESGGKIPGRTVFERQTGIRRSDWYGVYWARWGDALKEAGFSANTKQNSIDQDFILQKLSCAVLYYKKFPTHGEMRLYRRVDPDFPSHSTISNRFASKKTMMSALREWSRQCEGRDGIMQYLPDDVAESPQDLAGFDRVQHGYVYLIKSGNFYKIGRSDNLENRIKSISVALPEAVNLVHVIRTDDSVGIEQYWHRRFGDRRANGEWFRLLPGDIAAFKRRKFQ